VKSYRQFCSVAKALDVVGDRWALLVVRELLLGPRRYTDLLEGLPVVGTNVLSTRLRELESAGIVTRRPLPAPTAVTVYDLTDDGRDLRGVLDALAQWGARRLDTPADGDAVEPRWFVASLAARIDSSRLDEGATFELRLDDEIFTVAVEACGAIARHGAPANPTASLTGSLRNFFAASRGSHVAARRITTDGDRRAAGRLIDAVTACGRRPADGRM
jgi:DNA-binding HxlR family transcriptional regulator